MTSLHLKKGEEGERGGEGREGERRGKGREEEGRGGEGREGTIPASTKECCIR